MKRKVIFTKGAPKPGGAYSQAIVVGDLVFTAAIPPRDPGTGELLFPNDISKQTDVVLKNLAAILVEAGASLETVVRINAFINDRSEFAAFDKAYQKWFPCEPPARTTLAVGKPGSEQRVSMDAIAVREIKNIPE